MIKTVCAISFLAFVTKADETQGTDYESDFFQGMENGFFLRDDLNAYKEYECPDLVLNEQMYGQTTQVFGPIKMLLGLVNNDAYQQMWGIVELFISSIMKLSSSVSGYSGSQYCSGLMFGMHGSHMLIEVGRGLLEFIDTIEQQEWEKKDRRLNPDRYRYADDEDFE